MNNTIMIVDDMKLNIDILAESLSGDYSIIPATSGESAMKMLQRKKPDIVLLDVFMPGVNGFDVLKFMKEQNELDNIPVIFVTGERDSDVEEKGLALGAVDYVKKPYNPNVVRVKVQNHLELKAYRDKLEYLVDERTKQLNASREAIIMGMSLMSELHDKVTGDHIDRIKSFTRSLANKLLVLHPEMISYQLAKETILFSPLHDVGKIAITDAVLKKTGVLTDEEFELMKSHTTEGANLLRKTTLFFTDDESEREMKTAIEIAECHHEKFDGRGYPHGYKGEEIPVSARIVSLADIYDALRSPRPYKKSFSHKESADIITVGDGRTMPTHFDPRVLEAFKAVEEEFAAIYDANAPEETA
jgi:putative two-component system response regulator